MNAGCANCHENTVEINKLTSFPLASPWIFSSCLCSGSRNYIFEHFLPSLSRLFLLLLSLLCPAPLSVPVQLCVHRPRAAPSLGEQAGAAVLPPLLCVPLVPHWHSGPCMASGSLSRQELKWVTVPQDFSSPEKIHVNWIFFWDRLQLWWAQNTDFQCREGKCQLLLSFI